MTPWPYPFWIAHRGAGELAPENTLAAFRLGARHGWRMFECDVKLSADGVPFLLHDSTLERTTNGHGVAGEQPWSALARLDAGSWHSRAYAGEPIPTLEDVARWCLAGGRLLTIEIKPTPSQEAVTGRVVAESAARLWQDAAVSPLLISFSAEALQATLQAAPQLPRGLLLERLWDGWASAAQRLGCAAIVCDHVLWNAALVAQARTLGLRCLAYTVNSPPAAERLIRLGIDGIITDQVGLFNLVLRSTKTFT
ncbi:MAG: glycerophosphodiester phosphodiesterase [Burkholderiaceae bacterium]|jgi:glycerophosphoryl diester phosphodiesterase|nr:glycerophosphodiester phosphodiesterase [Burkholderiaceae bacterium]